MFQRTADSLVSPATSANRKVTLRVLPNKEKEPRVRYVHSGRRTPSSVNCKVHSRQGQDLVMVQLQVNGKKCEFEVDSGA